MIKYHILIYYYEILQIALKKSIYVRLLIERHDIQAVPHAIILNSRIYDDIFLMYVFFY